jgi:hypothetical protein
MLYSTYDASFSHVYSFCLITLLFYFTIKHYESKPSKHYINAIIIGILIGLIAMVRITNCIIVVIFLLYNVQSIKDLIFRIRSNIIPYLLAFLVALLVFSPQCIYWYLKTGHIILNGYTENNEGFNWLRPQILNLLFSITKGLFYWTPSWIFAHICIFQKKQYNVWKFALALYLPIQLYVCSSWNAWGFGGSYGQRPYVDILVIYAIGLALILNASLKVLSGNNQETTKISWLHSVVTGLLIIWGVRNVLLSFAYIHGMIPSDGPTLQEMTSLLFH